MVTPRPVVLVHGAWHGGWCFAALQHALDELGVPSYAPDLPGHGASTAALTDLHGDARSITALLSQLDTPAVLVGHSYGGGVITQAAEWHGEVAHLVYLAAFALLEGESIRGSLRNFPPEEIALSAAMVPCDDGTTVLDPVLGPPALYGDCAPAVVASAVARWSPQPHAAMTQAVTGSPLGRIPSTYVVCTRDLAVHPNHQRAMAARCDHHLTIDCDHSPFLSRVHEVAALLHRLAVEDAS